ncbi:PH-like domain-containing protein [Microbacterium memoriense]|uniref:PH domain-containing protein n=1 Tax=Microbacterium memoriense TaxID=2978350 RepID=A0ABT2P826_9MICO|nr:hypothetical protein [Microbacterium memoriense]MCT9000846.1 hypothetical protein [Microbacterium memoriense]
MTREMVIALMIALAVVLIALGVWAWLRRTRRDGGLVAPIAEAPADAVVVDRFEGFYVATTAHDAPLERLAIRGLGFRSRAAVTVMNAGVALDLTGQPRMFVPVADIVSVDRATVAIDRVVEPGGLVRLSWLIGDVTVDTFLRAQDAGSRALADAIAGILPRPLEPSTPTIPTGTDA